MTPPSRALRELPALTLRRGEVICLTQRDHGTQWAVAVHGKEGPEGLVPLPILEARVYVQRCQTSERR